MQHPQHGVAAGVATDVRALLDARLPADQESLLTALGARDERNREADRQALRTLLEDLLENYLGPQRLVLTPGGGSGYFSQQATLIGEPEVLPGGSMEMAVKDLVDCYAPALKEMHDAGIAHVVGDKSWLADAKLKPSTPTSASDKMEQPAPTSTGLSADWAITEALKAWWSRKGSEMLWISTLDYAGDVDGSADRRLAADVVAFAGAAAVSRGSGGAVAAYRFERVDAEGRVATPREHFLRFVYSLIYQIGSTMAQHIPSTAAGASTKHRAVSPSLGYVSMNPARFICLNGKYESMDNALELLRDMLRLRMAGDAARGRVLIVIDGLEALDFSSDTELDSHIATLLGILEDKASAAEVKTLFLTGEHSQLLSNAIGPQNMVDASLLGGSEGFLDRETFERALELDSS